jgi:glutamine amidotransferase
MRRRLPVCSRVWPKAPRSFTHSYAAPITPESAATCEHGTEFAAAVEIGHIFGVQFHPEKSSDAGIRILRNFVAAAKG